MRKREDAKWAICCDDICFDGTDIWFVHSRLNILFCVDIEQAYVKKIYLIPYDEYYADDALYKGIVSYGEFICLIPGFANRIVFFNKKTEKFETIETKHELEWKAEYYFVAGYIYKHFLYCIPGAGLELVRIDLKTKEKKYLNDFSVFGEKNNLYGCYATKWKDEIIVRPCSDGTDLLLIDLRKESVSRLKTNVNDLTLRNIQVACIDDFVFMCSYFKYDSFLRKVDLNTGEVVAKVEIDSKIRLITRVLDYVVVDYLWSPNYDVYNKELHLVYRGQIKLDKTLNLFRQEANSQYVTWKESENGLIGCFHNGENRLYVYHKYDKKFKKIIDINVDISYLNGLKQWMKKEKNMELQEYDLYTLSDFLDEDMKPMCMNSRTNIVGNAIYKYIK